MVQIMGGGCHQINHHCVLVNQCHLSDPDTVFSCQTAVIGCFSMCNSVLSTNQDSVTYQPDFLLGGLFSSSN